MKKSYFLMAAAATLFAACSQSDVLNEVQVQDQAQAIGFSTYAGKATRAENNESAKIASELEAHHESFSVWGYKDTYTGLVFDDATVKKNADAWEYEAKKYWDKAATIYQFYAATPVEYPWVLKANDGNEQSDDYFSLENFSLLGRSLKETTYQASFSSVADQDLMIASPCKVVRDNFGQKVQLNFNHILSRLNVTVDKGANIAGETLNVTSFKVYNLKNTGTFNESLELNAAGTAKRWTTTDATYEIAGYGLDNVNLNNAGNQYIFQALVIPQPAGFEPIDRNAGIGTPAAPYFIIEYTIDGEPYSARFNLSNAFGDKDGMVLCEGYQNILHLTIDADVIEFNASVYEWTDKNVNYFEIK